VPTQAERSEATRARLLAVAHKLFAGKGYAATSLELLVRRAGVTKGAFYHHFADKEAIFRAVFEETEQRLVEAAAAGARGGDALTRFRTGCLAFLKACLAPGVQRIVLRDGPAVLGWETWREIDWRYGLARIEDGLRQAMAEGQVKTRPTKPLAHLLFGALCESAMVIARAPKPRQAMAHVRRELDQLLEAMLRER
jgi:AcrR family transcriptional regulator